jgi:hypothetical protein
MVNPNNAAKEKLTIKSGSNGGQRLPTFPPPPNSTRH